MKTISRKWPIYPENVRSAQRVSDLLQKVSERKSQRLPYSVNLRCQVHCRSLTRAKPHKFGCALPGGTESVAFGILNPWKHQHGNDPDRPAAFPLAGEFCLGIIQA